MPTTFQGKMPAEKIKKFMIAPSEFAGMQHSNTPRLLAMKKQKPNRNSHNLEISVKH